MHMGGWGGLWGSRVSIDTIVTYYVRFCTVWHNGIKFKCDDCGKEGFSTKGALTRHLKNACPATHDRPIQNPAYTVALPGAVVVARVIGKKG